MGEGKLLARRPGLLQEKKIVSLSVLSSTCVKMLSSREEVKPWC